MDIHYTARLSQDKHSGNMANLTSEWFCYACIPGSCLVCSFGFTWHLIEKNNNSQVQKNSEILKISRQFKLLKQRILCL